MRTHCPLDCTVHGALHFALWTLELLTFALRSTIVGTTLKRYEAETEDEISFGVGGTLFINSDDSENEM